MTFVYTYDHVMEPNSLSVYILFSTDFEVATNQAMTYLARGYH